MNNRTDNERLLADVLAAEADASFSTTVLADTLRGVRRRRRLRQLGQYGALVVLLTAALLISSHFLRHRAKPELARSPQPVSYQLVVSQPLSPGQVVGTQALAPSQRVISTNAARLVQTAPGGFGEIGDDELMALVAPRVVALVRRGPNAAELVFVASPTENPDSHQN